MTKRIIQYLLALALLAAMPFGWAVPDDDGLYAQMQTTMGEFVFSLYYRVAPRTCANFVNLAEGHVSWLNPVTGQVVKRPYYDGIIFHRVIDDFMMQCGSPRGDGTDGPGYIFSDEFDDSLKHDRPGTVSMANSGEDTNGGQIFITSGDASWLDGKHAVFGRIVEGMNVVSNIAAVATDTNDVPLDPITITNVNIIRQGAEAQAWDPDSVSPPLPIVRPATNRVTFNAEKGYLLDWDEHPSCVYWLYGTADPMNIENWGDLMGQPVLWDQAGINNIVSNNPAFFFNVTEVEYSEFFE